MICSAHFWGASLRVCFSIFNLCWYSQIVGLEVEQRDKQMMVEIRRFFQLTARKERKLKERKPGW